MIEVVSLNKTVIALKGQQAAELFIPSMVDDLASSGKATVKVLSNNDLWFGVTYRKDRLIAIRCIRNLIGEGVYPERLWE